MTEQLTESQHVTLTGRTKQLQYVLDSLKIDAAWYDVTITVHTPSVPESLPGLDGESRISPADGAMLLDLMDNPPEPTPELVKAMRKCRDEQPRSITDEKEQ